MRLLTAQLVFVRLVLLTLHSLISRLSTRDFQPKIYKTDSFYHVYDMIFKNCVLRLLGILKEHSFVL